MMFLRLPGNLLSEIARWTWLAALVVVMIGLAPAPAAAQEAAPAPLDTVLSEPAQELAEEVTGEEHGVPPPVWLVVPFVALLAMIATGPLFYPHHWHHHYPKWAIGLGIFVGLYYLLILDGFTSILHAVHEYISFIALLASLFVAAGGILIRINQRGTPAANSVILFVGAVISNLIGTTGASMLLIRPFMRLNEGRLKAYHIIFFIFVVSNVGGALTPIGDPPLFLGFLRGVPFFWTVTHIWYIWLPTVLLLIGLFWVMDARNRQASTRAVEPGVAAVRFTGAKNFLWLAVIIGSVFLDPNVLPWVPALHVGDFHLPFGVREIIMFGVCVLAYKTADREALAGNGFNFEPIKEVAFLFVGIFLTMVPALQIISAFAQENAGILNTTTFYWATGALSGILDNAPTYLNFVAAAMGKFGLSVNDPGMVKDFADPLLVHPDSWLYLQAISVAAVFFGALTYIGNGPNFMVKAIAESDGVETPSFFGYIVRYSLPILLPVYFLVWLIFFSGYFIQA